MNDPDRPVSTAALHNARHSDEQSGSGLPLAILIHEGGDVAAFLATPVIKGDTLILELDDGREIELDRLEITDRAAA